MSAFAIDPITVAGEGATRASTATYTNSAGKVAVAAVNELRFNYDPLDLAAPPVVLVERAPAINLLSYPRNFDNAAHGTPINSTLFPQSAISPDGLMAASTVLETTANGVHAQDLSAVAFVAGSTYTFSIVTSAVGGRNVALYFPSTVFAGRNAAFDLTAGTVINSAAGITPKIEPLGSGVYRCSITGICASSASSRPTYFTYNAGISFVGDPAKGLRIWHAQLTLGAAPSSIIPDATAFVSRASDKWEFNSAGVLSQHAPNVAVTAYDPATLVSRGLSLEAAATNLCLFSEDFTNAAWIKSNCSVQADQIAAPNEAVTADQLTRIATGNHYLQQNIADASTANKTYTFSIWMKLGTISAPGIVLRLRDGIGTNIANSQTFNLTSSWKRISVTGTCGPSSAPNISVFVDPADDVGSAGETVFLWGAMVTLESVPSSYIPTTTTAVTRAADISTSPPTTRAADVLGTGALLASNVLENEYPTYSATGVYGPGERVISAHEVHEQLLGSRSTVTLSIASPCVVTHAAHGFANGQPVKLTTTGALPTGLAASTTCYVVNQAAGTYQLSATVGGAAINTSGTQSGVHTLTANAIGQAPGAGSLYWTDKGVSNQRMMFDEFNNTATLNAEVIRIALQPRAVAGGMYLGGLVGADVRVTMVEPNGSKVYSKEVTLLRPTTGVSYYNWMFSRIKRTSMVVLSDLPAYYDGVLMVEIRNPGATAACAMLGLGPVTDLGLGQYGVSRDITDYSSETFNVDGSSVSVPRGYSKGMDLDIVIDNKDIDELTELIESFHQRFLIYIASEAFKHTVVAGKYSSFKTVITDFPFSRMSLSIKGKI